MAFRRPNYVQAQHIPLPKEHGSVSATTTLKVYKVAANRAFRLHRALYLNPTGLAGASGNAFVGTVQKAANVSATLFNTNTGAGGATLAANTFVEGTLSATEANTCFAGGDEVSLVLTLTGTATLPAGTLVLEGSLY